jgi:hypothetical protein
MEDSSQSVHTMQKCQEGMKDNPGSEIRRIGHDNAIRAYIWIPNRGFNLVYTRYIPGIFQNGVYIWYIPGIYLV